MPLRADGNSGLCGAGYRQCLTVGAWTAGKNGGSKSSLSADSPERGPCATPEPQRRSKSILKKADAGSRGASAGRGCGGVDPETEKLISDTASLDSECSPARRPQPSAPAAHGTAPGPAPAVSVTRHVTPAAPCPSLAATKVTHVLISTHGILPLPIRGKDWIRLGSTLLCLCCPL